MPYLIHHSTVNKRKVTISALIILLLLSSIVALTVFPSAKAVNAPSITGWSYNLQLTIAQDQTLNGDNQLRVIIHYGSGLNSNASFYLNGLCQSDFEDIRFLTLASYNSNPSNPWLPQWNQTCYVGDNATWWFRDHDNLYAKDSTVYLYYGNPSANSNSNKSFVFFDVISNVSAAYSMDEGTGTVLIDTSGNGNTGTIYNSDWTTDSKYGAALQFDGLNSYVDCGDINAAEGDTSLSVFAWIKPNNLTQAGIVSKDDGTARPWYLRTDITDGSIGSRLRNTTGSATDFISSLGQIKKDTWSMIGFVWDNNTKIITEYANNSQILSPTVWNDTLISGTDHVTIGRYYSNAFTFNGTMDEVFIITHALNTSQVSNLYIYYPDSKISNGELLLRTPFINQPTITAGSTSSDHIFTVAWIADVQASTTSDANVAYLNQMMNYITNNVQNLNIKMVINSGDFVNNGSFPAFITRANAAYSIFQNSNLPYCWNTGNHDVLENETYPYGGSDALPWDFPNYSAFNLSVFRQQNYYLSDYGAGVGADGSSTATRISFNGYSFIFVCLAFNAEPETITWMTNLLDSYPNDNIILSAHSYLNDSAGYGWMSTGAGDTWSLNLKTILNNHSNVKFTVSGHDWMGAPYYSNYTNVNGREEVFMNRQAATDLGVVVRFFTIDISTSICRATTYLSYNDTWLADEWNQFSFSLSGLSPEPTPSLTPSVGPVDSVVNPIYSMLPLLSLLVVVVVGGLVLVAFRGEIDGPQLVSGFIVIVLVGIGVALVIAILANVQVVTQNWFTLLFLS